MKKHYILFIIIAIFLFSCNASKTPYECGPVLKQKKIEKTFPDLIEKIGLSAGDVFADVGASSGVIDVAISMFTKDVTFYLQDIDKDCLNQTEFTKIIDYYSEQSKQDLNKKNKFIITIGDKTQTNLPDNTFDIIYSNATFHAFELKEKMVADIYKKLKVGGNFIIRDEFAEKGEIKYCPEEGGRFVEETELLEILENNGFIFIEKYEDFNGYPMFKFQKVQ